MRRRREAARPKHESKEKNSIISTESKQKMDKNNKNTPKGHVIKKQTINIKTNVPRERVKAIQDEILSMYKKRILPKMEALFDRLVPSDVHIYLDKIVLDLDAITVKQLSDLEGKILSKIEKQVRSAMAKKGIRPLTDYQTGARAEEAQVEMKRDLLTAFLEDGYYPSWADVSNMSAPELMEQMLADSPAAVLVLLDKIGMRAAVQRRLIYQFGTKAVDKILELLYGEHAKEAMKQLSFLQKRLMRQFPAASVRKVERLTQAAALRYVMDKKSKSLRFKYDERDFNRNIIEQVQTEYEAFGEQGSGGRSRVRSGYESNYQDIDILKYFLENGSIPMWADVDSKSTLQQIFVKLLASKLVPLQKLVERGADNPYFLQRLVYQFPTAQLMRLLEPISGETIDFIEESIQALKIFTQARTGISRTLATQDIREKVLTTVLEYAFRRKRSNFVKQTIFQEVIERLAPALGVSTTVVMEELINVQQTEPTRFAGDVATVINAMTGKQTASQERQAVQQQKIQAELSQVNLRIAEIEQLMQGAVSKEMGKALRQERAQLLRQQTSLTRQEATFSAKEADAQAVFLEWSAMEQQKSNNAQEAIITKAQEALVQRLEQRLAIVLKDLEAAYAQANSTEKTLLLQRLSKEISSIVSFFEQRLAGFAVDLDLTQTALTGAANSKERQRWRKRREALQKQITEQTTTLTNTQTEARKLSTLIADLTRVTIKQGEDIDGATTETEAEEAKSSGRSKLDYLVFFLEFGAIPWWAEEYKNLAVEGIFMEALQKDSGNLRKAFSRLGRTPILWQRLVNQLSETALTELVKQFYTRQSKFVLAQVELLERIFTSRAFKSLKANVKEFKWSKIIEILLLQDRTSEADFLEQLVKITALDFNVAPSELMSYMYNIIDNVGREDLQTLAPLLEQVANSVELREVEEELVRVALKQKLQEQGMLLSDVEKLGLLQEFLMTSRFSPEAKRVQFDSVDKMEQILAELIDANLNALRSTFFDLLRNPRRADFILKTFSPGAFWQIIQTLSPSGVSIIQRYFGELSHALQDKQLSIEKTMLLLFVRDNYQKVFDPKFFVQELIEYVAAETSRSVIAIASDWKRKIQSISTNSTLSLYIMAIELETLKQEPTPPETLQAQIIELNTAYTTKAQQSYAVLQQDSVETKGVPDELIALDIVYKALAELQQELNNVNEQLKNLDPSSAIVQTINARTKQAQLLAQIELLQRKEPAQIRLKKAQIATIEEKIIALQTAKKQSEIEAEEAKDIANSEQPNVSYDNDELPKPQRKAELIARIEFLAQNPDTKDDMNEADIKDIDNELKILIADNNKDNEQIDLLNLLDIAEIIAQAPADSPLQQLKTTIANIQTPNIEEKSERINQNIVALIPQQANILKPLQEIQALQTAIQRKLKKEDLPTLLKNWQDAQNLQDQVLQLIEKDKNLSKNEALFEQLIELDELQIQLYRQVRREQERRNTAQIKAIHLDQKQLLKAVRLATTPEDLMAIGQQLDKAEVEEIEQLTALSLQTKDKAVKADFDRAQRNIRTYFKRLRSRYIWQRARLMKQQAEVQEKEIQIQKQLQKQREAERQEIIKSLYTDQKETVAEAEQVKEENKAKRKQQQLLLPPSKPIDEPLFIKNAGLVILTPYLLRYLDILKLVQNKAFISVDAQYKAVHLLQYLVTKKIETPENDLILNKILCGLPLNAPVPLSADISEAELKFSESMLQGAINNWARLKTMSPDAMRSTFLIRNAKIIEEADRFKLVVDKGSFDMLLRTITWGFTFVKYPWMQKAIFVEWNYM
jgi:hypothetical protein